MIILGIVLVCCLVVHCMVVWLTGTQHLHVLAVQRSLTVVRPSQAFYDWCDMWVSSNNVREIFDSLVQVIMYSLSVCMCNIRRFYWLRELYETDFHKPGIYGSGRVWANAWDVFRRTPSRGGHGRWAAVDFVVNFGWGEFLCVCVCFFFRFLFFERTRPNASTRPPCLIYLCTSILAIGSTVAGASRF